MVRKSVWIAIVSVLAIGMTQAQETDSQSPTTEERVEQLADQNQELLSRVKELERVVEAKAQRLAEAREQMRQAGALLDRIARRVEDARPSAE